MNKLFTRIGVAFAGIAMAIGVGVAVGQSPRAVERVDAAGVVDDTKNTVTWNLASSTYDSGASADSVTWSSTRATILLEKNGSSTAANNYLGGSGSYTHTRFYKDHKITISSASGYGIKSIVFTATDTTYAGNFSGATLTNATGAKSGSVATITATDSSKNVVIVIKSATRATQMVVNYTAGGTAAVTISYNANGGSGTMSTSTNTENASSCTFVPPSNKVFNGWNTKANGSGTPYAVDASLSDITEDTPLYAQWTNRPALSGSETLFYTLSCTNTLKNTDNTDNLNNTSYTSYYDVVSGGVTWNAPGNQNNATYWRVGGGKNAALEDKSITITTTSDVNNVNKPVTKIVLRHGGKSNANLKVNYIQLDVGDEEFNDIKQTIKYTPAIDVSTAGSLEFYASTNSLGADELYYQFTFNVTTPKGSNMGIDVNSIQFFYDLVSSNYATDLAVSPTSITPTKGSLINDTLAGLTITASVNGAASAAYSNYSVTVTRRDDSVDVVNDSTIFRTGDKKLTITALDPTTQGGSTFASVDVNTSVSYTATAVVGNKYALTSDGNVFNGQITSNYGSSEAYSNTPSQYGFIVEDGLYEGTVAFKLLSGDNANKYIAWSGTSGQLAISNTKTALATWVAFNNGEDDVIANASNENATLRFNSGANPSRFAGYTSETGDNADLLLLGTSKCDTFASTYMKMDSYDVGGKKGDDHGDQSCKTYYQTAKAVFNGEATGADEVNNLSSDERALICDTNGLYAATYERLKEWARINGESINSLNDNVLSSGMALTMVSAESNNTVAFIVVIAAVSTLAIGGFFFLRKRKIG